MRSLPLKFAGKLVNIYGGPYFHCPPTFFGVKVAREIDMPCDINLPIPDFSIPDEKLAKRALLQCIRALQQPQPIYVGCWGGKGRTGLFLALLAKVSGIQNPVDYVRSSFHPHAVETDEQKKFVEDFPTFWLSVVYQALSSAEKSKTLIRHAAGTSRPPH
jgi:hypothetical protein